MILGMYNFLSQVIAVTTDDQTWQIISKRIVEEALFCQIDKKKIPHTGDTESLDRCG